MVHLLRAEAPAREKVNAGQGAVKATVSSPSPQRARCGTMLVMAASPYAELVPVPRAAIRLPLELPIPPGFVADRPETWPYVEGEIEYVGGKLLYLPPSGDRQQDTSADVVGVLFVWRRTHRDFLVAGNEAGMILGGEVRGAGAAVWRKRDAGAREGKYRRVAPVLAIEIQGELEDEASLRSKAAWYLAHGVEIVWLVFPKTRSALVLTPGEETVRRSGERMPRHPSLPDLEPTVDELMEQIDEAG
jgi:Uma2 family endonuclease